MATVEFTPNLQRILACPTGEHPGECVADVLRAAFETQPRARTYVLDDQGRLRKHMQVFVNGEQVADRNALSDRVGPTDRIFVMQALSGG